MTGCRLAFAKPSSPSSGAGLGLGKVDTPEELREAALAAIARAETPPTQGDPETLRTICEWLGVDVPGQPALRLAW